MAVTRLLTKLGGKTAPSAIATLQGRGDSARDERRWMDAMYFYRSVVELDPRRADISVQFGHAAKEAGLFEIASKAYADALRARPDDDDLLLQIGHLEKVRGNPDMAEAWYRRALALNPGNPDARAEIDALHHPPQPHQPEEPEAAAPEPEPDEPEPTPAPGQPALHLPKDPAAWMALAETCREADDLEGATDALRACCDAFPNDAAAHRHLGDVLHERHDPRGAIAAYRVSFALSPRRDVALRLTELDAAPSYDETRPSDARPQTNDLDISDLLRVLSLYPSVSGIQRVQISLIRAILDVQAPAHDFVTWGNGHLWRLDPDTLTALLDNVDGAEPFDPERRRTLVKHAEQRATLVTPAPGDIVLTTGVIYFRPDIIAENARLKRAGVRLGAIIYDYIPITHPEYVARHGVLEFGATMSEALATLDFVLPISDHVRLETARLLDQAGYPPLPARVLHLAHAFGSPAAPEAPATGEWTPAIADLNGAEYVLCVGSAYRHKNHLLLLQVWKLLLESATDVPTLVLAGKHRDLHNDLHHELDSSEALRRCVRIVDAPTDQELTTLYRHCLFTMLPSFVEGWGLPVGESLSHGKLCIAADVASIPEVGGDFVLYMDPYSARDCAALVTGLLHDRTRLHALERRIRDSFQPRLWSDVGKTFLAALADPPCGPDGTNRAAQLALPAGAVQRVRTLPLREWVHGTHLPPADELATMVRPRLMVGPGWHPLEGWGVWMREERAQIEFETAAPKGTPIQITLQFRTAPWSIGNALTITAEGGAPATIHLPLPTWPEQAWLTSTLLVSATVGAHGRVRIGLRLHGGPAKAWWDERDYTVGLCALSWSPLDNARLHVPPGRFVSAANPAAADLKRSWPFRSQALDVLRRLQPILVEGWLGADEAGSSMAGRTATLRFHTDEPSPGRVQLTLLLRGAAGTRTRTTLAGGADPVTVSVPGHPAADLAVQLTCVVRPGGLVHLSIEADAEPGPASRKLPTYPWICLLGFGYASLPANDAPHAALPWPAAMQPIPGDPGQPALVDTMRFTVMGHIKGSYSLAAVNRALAIALDGAFPGRVRVEQIENGLTRDLGGIEPAERAVMARLTARLPHQGGPEITVSQHWPVWVPENRGDLTLAWVAWEESRLPPDMVATLKQHFDGVIVQTRSVRKALIDSGLRLPVILFGCAPDLTPYLAIGNRRRARDPVRAGTPAAPFTFLHVSSCFPRKGVDVLLAAYAAAFRRSDPVRLVIKTFPNIHHDTAKDVRRLQQQDPGLPLIEVITADMQTEGLAALSEHADAMVLPTRGEGYNLPAAEALAAGLPLIVTGHGGQCDFAGPDAARQIDYVFDYSKTHLAAGPSIWADPDQADLQDALTTAASAHRNPVAAATIRSRVTRGREIARQIAQPHAWAARLAKASATLLQRPLTTPASVAWVTTWNLRCGIAEYSRHLLASYPGHVADTVILHDERTPQDIPTGTRFQTRPAWRVHDSSSIDGLAEAIEQTCAQVVVIQQHKGLIHWRDLVTLLADPRVARRKTVVTLHNVQEYAQGDEADALTKALASATRVLVHTAHDLNLLKRRGLIENVALFPQGAPKRTTAVNPASPLPRTAAPIVGAYGFFLPHKGFAVLIEAFAKVKQQWPDAVLRLVTAEYPNTESRDEIDRCRRLADALGLDGIAWHLDYLPSDASLSLLAGCDLVVLPYQETQESSSAAVRSALASGAPVAVTPIRVFDDTQQAVLRMDGTDADTIAASICRILADTTLRADTQAAAARWLDAHDWTAGAIRMEGLLTSLVLNT